MRNRPIKSIFFKNIHKLLTFQKFVDRCPHLKGFSQIQKIGVFWKSQSLAYLELSISSKSDDFWRFYSYFRKKVTFFMVFFLRTTKTAKIMCFSGVYHHKIAKNSPILMKLTVPNRQDFAIFKKPRFFEFGWIYIGEGSDLQIFGRLKSYVCS